MQLLFYLLIMVCIVGIGEVDSIFVDRNGNFIVIEVFFNSCKCY